MSKFICLYQNASKEINNMKTKEKKIRGFCHLSHMLGGLRTSTGQECVQATSYHFQRLNIELLTALPVSRHANICAHPTFYFAYICLFIIM